MATRIERSAETRVRLSRDRVLRAAISLADDGGLEALSMRKLAQELGVEAMSVYYHVSNKDEILSQILDLVVGEFALPSAAGDWRTAVRKSAISAHEVLVRHPWACPLMMSPAKIGPARLAYMEALLGCLRRAGFSANMTHHAYHALDSHILGFTMWEVGYTSGIRELPDSGAGLRRRISLDDHRYLIEHMGEHEKPGGGSSEFAFGLDLILDGLEKLRVKPRRARTGTPRVKPRRRPSC